MRIHPTAIVENGAALGEGVRIGAYCRVSAETSLGDEVELISHVVVEGRTSVGARTIVHPFAVIGGPPQHLGDRGEDTCVRIGADCIVREHATVNRGTLAGGGETVIGDRCFLMTGAHVAHDCIVGSNVVFANNATLGGHVIVEEFAFLGGLCAIHQHCRVGAYAFIGGCAGTPTDVIPYGSAIGNHAHLAGLNIVGMKRRGMSRAAIHEVRAAYRALFSEGGTFWDRLERAEAKFANSAEARRIFTFIRQDARRPLMMPMSKRCAAGDDLE